MKTNLLFKYLSVRSSEYIFIILTATIFLLTSFTKSFSKEDVFVINNVKVEGKIDLNFKREKYLNKAFINSFDILMSKILLTRDATKVKNIKLDEIKLLISSFQIKEESYGKEKYLINLKIFYDELEIKKYLGKKNISFSQPENISALFYPVLFIDEKIQNLNENYFYNNWSKIIIKNETVNFLLPIEDLEDTIKILEMKDSAEDTNINKIVKKYNIKNYIFALMDFQNNKLNTHLKINFNNTKLSKNYLYEIKNLDNENELNDIIKDLKLKISDIWKEENLINLLMPLSINLKFEHKNLENLENLRITFQKIDIINNSILEQFDINNSYFKIYYYGNPKKLESKLLKFGYRLENIEGFWQIYLNE